MGPTAKAKRHEPLSSAIKASMNANDNGGGVDDVIVCEGNSIFLSVRISLRSAL